MATTRRQPPMHIFQDPPSSAAHHGLSTYDSHLLDGFASVTDVSSDHHTLLEPPQNFTHGASPRKTRHASSSPPPHALADKSINAVNIPPPREQSFMTDAPTKKAQRPIPKQSQLMASQRPLFTNFASQFDQENVCSAPDSALPNFPASDPPLKPVGKRSLAEAAPLDRKSTRLNSSHWITSRMPSSA